MYVVAPTVAVYVREPICRIIPRMMFLILVTTHLRPYYQPLVAQPQTSYAPLSVPPLFLPCCVHCFADRLRACPTNQTSWWAWARDANNNRVRVYFRALFLRTCAPNTYSSPARFRSPARFVL